MLVWRRGFLAVVFDGCHRNRVRYLRSNGRHAHHHHPFVAASAAAARDGCVSAQHPPARREPRRVDRCREPGAAGRSHAVSLAAGDDRRRSGARRHAPDRDRRDHPPDGADQRRSPDHRRGTSARARRRRESHGRDDDGHDFATARSWSTKSLEVDAYVRRIQEQVDRALSLTSSLSQELRGRRRESRRPAAPCISAGEPARPAGGRKAVDSRGRAAARQARSRVRRARARNRAARDEGQDRIAGAAGNDGRAAPVLPAPAVEGDSGGAGRGRGRRDQAAAREGRSRESSRTRR